MNIPSSLSEIRTLISSSQLTLADLVEAYLEQIRKTSTLNIYVEVYADEALTRAKYLDNKYQSDPTSIGRLFGAVISIKDVLCYKSHVVTAASGILKGFQSQFSATAIQKALEEDVIIIGRTNCDEFAMGSTNEHSVYGPTLNGLDSTRVPGGSSGAAAVSVQQKTCHLALGSDTGGSVRQPSAWCGVTGFKPTYGRISRYGLIAYASSFDQIGIVGTKIKDISLLLSVIEGRDEMDATSAHHPATVVNGHTKDQPSKIAFFPEVLNHPTLNPKIRTSAIKLIENLAGLGHIVEEKHFSLLDYLVPTYYVLTTAEASSNLNRYDGLRYGHQSQSASEIQRLISESRTEGFGEEVKRRIMMGTFVLSVGYFDAYFAKAQKVRRMICEQVDEIFREYDFILMPTVTDLAPKLQMSIQDPVKMYLADIFTVLANLSGIPAISLPIKDKTSTLSFGIQLMSKKFDEGQLLTFAEKIQSLA